MEGVQVEGVRFTRTITGRDGQAYTVSEVWSSPDLKLDVMVKLTDSAGREGARRLRNLRREEPRPELMHPPAGYELKDEEGEFTVSFSLRQ
jgi:hypothetical protein